MPRDLVFNLVFASIPLLKQRSGFVDISRIRYVSLLSVPRRCIPRPGLALLIIATQIPRDGEVALKLPIGDRTPRSVYEVTEFSSGLLYLFSCCLFIYLFIYLFIMGVNI